VFASGKAGAGDEGRIAAEPSGTLVRQPPVQQRPLGGIRRDEAKRQADQSDRPVPAGSRTRTRQAGEPVRVSPAISKRVSRSAVSQILRNFFGATAAFGVDFVRTFSRRLADSAGFSEAARRVTRRRSDGRSFYERPNQWPHRGETIYAAVHFIAPPAALPRESGPRSSDPHDGSRRPGHHGSGEDPWTTGPDRYRGVGPA
jgi:hypothetical protein